MRNHVQLELTRFHFLNRKSWHCLFICCIYESVIKIRSVVRILPPVAENIIGVTGLLSLAGAGLSFQADLVCHGENKATASSSFKMLSSVWKLQYSIEQLTRSKLLLSCKSLSNVTTSHVIRDHFLWLFDGSVKCFMYTN